MKIVLLGNEGMLGHVMERTLQAAGHRVHGGGRRFDVFGCIRAWQPEVVINCAGIVKQRAAAPEEFIEANSLLPWRLYRAARYVGARLIHFSTDCVFSGGHGAYTEDVCPAPVDLYGRSKLLGEVNEEGCLTIRTSLIGRELIKPGFGLLEWFLQSEPRIEGYTNAYFSGLSTPELARVVHRCILEQPQMSGIWNVAGPAISKFELLQEMSLAFDQPKIIVPTRRPMINRVLRADAFNARLGYTPPSWNSMLKELAQ